MLINYIINVFKYFFCILIFVILSLPANSEQSVEEIIKARKALFSKNYSTAKKVQTLSSKGEFEKAKSLMIAKNHDYDEAWRDMRVGSFTDLILQKLLRVKQIEDNKGETLVSEGIDANYFDMINYSIFALIKLSEK